MANTTDTMTPEEILRGIINGTLTELEDDGVTAIGARKFHNRTALTRVLFSNFNGSIGEYAFNGCSNLTSANFANVTTIGAYAFSGCSSLSSFSIGNNVTGLGAYAFNGCSGLSGSLDLPKVTSMGNYTFNNAGFTGTVNLPKLSTIKTNGFRNLKYVEYINTGTATFDSNGTSMFQGCTSLKGFAQHRTQYTTNDYFASSVFQDCPNLEYVDLGTFRGKANLFNGDAKLKTLVIRETGSKALDALSPFTGTPFASGGSGGTLYVRKSLIATYKSATNWSTILGYSNNMILPIEGSYYQMYFADGTAVSGASYSDAKYFMNNWGISYTDNVIWTSKSNARGCCIALRGDHAIRLNSSSGSDTHIYPIEIESGKSGVTITSGDLDLEVNEVYWDGTDWKRTGGSGWLLQSSGSSHSYTFTGSNTTHIYVNARVAGDTGDEGTVTQAMMDAITFAWNS